MIIGLPDSEEIRPFGASELFTEGSLQSSGVFIGLEIRTHLSQVDSLPHLFHISSNLMPSLKQGGDSLTFPYRSWLRGHLSTLSCLLAIVTSPLVGGSSDSGKHRTQEGTLS